MRLAPQEVTKDDWYYEYPTHMLLVSRQYDNNGDYLRTIQSKIYWRQIRKSLAFIDRPKKKRKPK